MSGSNPLDPSTPTLGLNTSTPYNRVRKINRLPVFVFVGLLGVIILTLTYGYVQSDKSPMAGKDQPKGAGANASAGLSAAEQGNVSKPPVQATLPDLPPGATAIPTVFSVPPSTAPVRSADDMQRDEARRRYLEEQYSTSAKRREQYRAALEADTNIAGGRSGSLGGAGGVGALATATQGSAGGFLANAVRSGVPSAPGGFQLQQDAAPQTPNPPDPRGAGLTSGEDPNGFNAKELFAERQTSGINYLARTREMALSRYELKAGTVVPGVLLTAINSELPGQIIGQVSENVRDTATGQFILIPQGARIIGRYDFQVTYGQDRVQVIWNRVVYPDGSSLDLGGMPGTDQAGSSGFEDEVNHHYVRLFGSALLVSAFSAGISLSQPQNTSILQSQSTGQTATSALGQQLGGLGTELARKNLSTAPTIQIRTGYRFEIMVTKDVIIQPWRP